MWKRRHRNDQISIDDHIAEHGEFYSGEESAPDQVFAQKELASRLKHAFDGLPFDQRTAIVLREIDGMSVEDIARSVNSSIGSVKSRLTRARLTLRAQLREARAR